MTGGYPDSTPIYMNLFQKVIFIVRVVILRYVNSSLGVVPDEFVFGRTQKRETLDVIRI